jgi:hypothetical protein
MLAECSFRNLLSETQFLGPLRRSHQVLSIEYESLGKADIKDSSYRFSQQNFPAHSSCFWDSMEKALTCAIASHDLSDLNCGMGFRSEQIFVNKFTSAPGVHIRCPRAIPTGPFRIKASALAQTHSPVESPRVAACPFASPSKSYDHSPDLAAAVHNAAVFPNIVWV